MHEIDCLILTNIMQFFQDVIDLAIYTAPVQILSPVLINMLHLSTMARFLRALILCSAYYLQVFIFHPLFPSFVHIFVSPGYRITHFSDDRNVFVKF